jgi:glycosyltransferase involved in cell wall biosynthesis
MTEKIVFFCPSIEEGGVEKNHFLIVKYFNKKKKRNIYLISANKDKKKKFKKKINYISTNVLDFSKSQRLIKSLVCFFLTFINFRNEQIKIVSFQSNILAIILSKILNCKVIIRSNSDPISFANSYIKKKIFRFFFKRANLIIVNSFEFQKNFFKILKLKPKVIYNPLFLEKKFKKRIYNSRYLRLLNIGRLTYQKNQILILKAIKYLNKQIPLKINIIGKGEKFNFLLKFIKKNNLQSQVKLIGYTNKTRKFFLKSDIFILSSKYEGLPNVLLEAIYYENLVISSDCPSGPKEILGYGKYGYLFKNNNYVHLANIIKKIYLKNIINLKKNVMIEKSKTSLNRFNFDKNIKKYYNTISNLK